MLASNTWGFLDKFWIPIFLSPQTILTQDQLDPNVFSDNPAGCRVCRHSLSVNNWLGISAVEILKFQNVWRPRSRSSLNQSEQQRVMPQEIFGIYVRWQLLSHKKTLQGIRVKPTHWGTHPGTIHLKRVFRATTPGGFQCAIKQNEAKDSVCCWYCNTEA